MNNNIIPHRITKPIQLLAAWFSALAVINGSFLTASLYIAEPDWIPPLLCIASILNVPLFIYSLFKLQTKYRPEMQEDIFYSKYLEGKIFQDVRQLKIINIEEKVEQLSKNIAEKFSKKENESKIKDVLMDLEIERLTEFFENNRIIAELYKYPADWKFLVDNWRYKLIFRNELNKLISAGLVTIENNDLKFAKLTNIGLEVAKNLEKQNKLWRPDPRMRYNLDE